MRDFARQVKNEALRGPSYIVIGFLQGLGWAFGATIGFALLVALITFLLKQFGQLPLVGGWFNQASETIEVTSPAKLKKEITK